MGTVAHRDWSALADPVFWGFIGITSIPLGLSYFVLFLKILASLHRMRQPPLRDLASPETASAEEVREAFVRKWGREYDPLPPRSGLPLWTLTPRDFDPEELDRVIARFRKPPRK